MRTDSSIRALPLAVRTFGTAGAAAGGQKAWGRANDALRPGHAGRLSVVCCCGSMNMRELIHARAGTAFGFLGPVVEVGAGGQGFRVLGAEDPLIYRYQRHVLVTGPGRIPRLP